MKLFLFKCALAASTLILLPLTVETVMRLAGAGTPAAMLLPHPDPLKNALIDNTAFTRPFFSRELERKPAALYIPRVKAADEFRVVVLGASAAMGDPMPEFGLPRMLQAVLEQAMTGRTVRVVNASVTAINSHVVRYAARDMETVEPDAVVIYLGNNEIVGPFGPGTVFSGFYRNRMWVRAAAAIRRSRIGQGLLTLRERASGDAGRTGWGGMEMFLDRSFGFDDPDVEAARGHYAANLADIASVFARRGIPVMLSTVAVNLDACPPFLSDDDNGLYLQARAAETAGDRTRALELYGLARDRDRLRFRADSAINGVVRDTAREYRDRGVRLVDAAQAFEDDYLAGRPGTALFVDHVHFTFEGNYRLAHLVADELLRTVTPGHPLPPDVSMEQCRVRLGFSPWAEEALWQKMAGRFRQPPFNRQFGWRERLADAFARDRAADAEKSADALAACITSANEALAAYPDDTDLLLWRGRYFLQADRPDLALQDFILAAGYLPHRETPQGHAAFLHSIRYGPQEALNLARSSWRNTRYEFVHLIHYTGSMLLDNGRFAEAAYWLEAGLRDDPGYPGMREKLIQARLMEGRPAEAVTAAGPEHRLDPRSLSLLGIAYGEQDRWDDALRCLEKAAAAAPGDGELAYNLAAGLARSGQPDAAAPLLASLLEQHPADIDAAGLYLNLLWNDGRTSEALEVFSAAAAFYPAHRGLLLRRAFLEARSGNVTAAKEVAGSIAAAGGSLRTPALRLLAWLEATTPPEDAAAGALFAFEPEPAMREHAAGLIEPAVLYRLTRTAEARQRLAPLTAAVRADPAASSLAGALRDAMDRDVHFTIPDDARHDDPVLDDLWRNL